MYELSEEQRDALMSYLSARPWKEVEPFMHMLGELKQVAPDACKELADNGYVDK